MEYIYVYIFAITLAFIAILFYFVMKEKKQKKISKRLEQEETVQEEHFIEPVIKTETKQTQKTIENVAVLEDFSLEDKTAQEQFSRPRRYIKQPVSIMNDHISDYIDEGEEIDEDEMEQNFFKYKELMSKRQKNEYESLSDFDFNSLKDKSEEEISEIFKSLPLKAQEMLLTNILAKKNYDEN